MNTHLILRRLYYLLTPPVHMLTLFFESMKPAILLPLILLGIGIYSLLKFYE